jgi:N-acetylmuramoyl-L-alanine amidase
LTTTPLLRLGDRGDAVRDLRVRLAEAGAALAPGTVFDADTEVAVREFQSRRGIRADGICGPETWGALIESGFELGGRLLYLSGEMLRGDDVGELQRRLNALGFDAGREDAILGPETEQALRSFQRNAGVTADGVCGPATLDALERVSGLAAGSVATFRERENLRHDTARLDGLRIFLVSEPGLAVLADTVSRSLGVLGAVVGLDTSGGDPGVLAGEANRFGARAFVALASGAEGGARCSYFASKKFRSEGGYALAQRLTESMRSVLKDVDDPQGRTFRLLRETRMAAVVCELLGRDDVEATAALQAHLPDVAHALVEGMRRGIEEPPGESG